MDDFVSKYLDSKPLNGDTYDLAEDTFFYKTGIYSSFITVNRSDEMRLDKISKIIYNSYEFIHELMKVNEIMNPFSIKNGDKIYHGSLINPETVTGTQLETEAARNRLIEEFKKSQVDQKRYDFLQEARKDKLDVSIAPRIDIPVPPTVTPPGFVEISVSSTTISITPSLSENGNNTPPNESVISEQTSKIQQVNKAKRKVIDSNPIINESLKVDIKYASGENTRKPDSISENQNPNTTNISSPSSAKINKDDPNVINISSVNNLTKKKI